MKRNSTNYVITLDVNSASDMEKLALIKSTIRAVNAYNSKQKRVVVRGRKPINVTNKSYDWGGNIVGGIKNASKLDVYIYDRRA